jgi:hypothetical protein
LKERKALDTSSRQRISRLSEHQWRTERHQRAHNRRWWDALKWAMYKLLGSRWRSWLRHCATNRNVAGSIPDGVGLTMALGSNQPLTEMSTRNLSWGVGCVRLTTLPPSCANCLKTWEPWPPGALRAPHMPVQGLLYLCNESLLNNRPALHTAHIASNTFKVLSITTENREVIHLNTLFTATGKVVWLPRWYC